MSSSSLSSRGQSEQCLYTCVVQDSYGRIIQPCSPAPFCKTMGQPFVYYTQVQCKKKCSKRKDRNCFVKAFHWYTQDLSDRPDDNSEQCPDVKGFAAWLDSKYCEYQQESETLRVHNLQSSTTDATPCLPCQPGTTKKKKFQRMRSPWCKRKRGNKNAGDTTSKANSPTASCQFILQPQDLTRPGSECGYQPPICEHRSNTTIIISKEYRESNRYVAKSRSMTSIYDETCNRNNINTITVQKAPPGEAKKPVTLVPCDQKCQKPTEQEIKMSQEMNQVPSKAQKVPCDPPCTIKQPQQVCYQNPTTKQQCIIKDKIQQDPPSTIQQNSTIKQEFKIREEIQQVGSKAQTVPCDPPCTIKPPHQVCYQKPTVKQECKIKKEMPSNSQKQTCEPRITQEQVSLQSHVLEMSCNVDRNKQECKIVEKTESMISVSQKIETPCDECYTIPCDECYMPKQEPKIKQETRQLPAKAHEYKNCDEDCTTKEACKINQEIRQQHAKVQKELKLMQAVHQTPPYFTCQESCPTPHDCKIMEKLKLMSRQWSNIPCDQSCVANKESKSVDERPSLSKQLTMNRSNCHKFCSTKEKCKFFEELLIRASNRSSYQTCMPKQECKFVSQNTVKPQKTQTVCEAKEFKMFDEIQSHTQSQGTSLHCEPIFKNEPQYVKRKQNIECQCPEESLAVKQNNSLQIETKYTPTKYTAQIATCTSMQVKSNKGEMDIECQCPPGPPPPVQVPKIKSSKREMDIECQCPPGLLPPVQAPKEQSSKREMDIECQCPPPPPPPVQAPKVKSSKREMDIECQCPPAPPPPVQAPKVNTRKREMETECECPPKSPPLVQADKVVSSKREMDIECQCPPKPSSLVAVPKVKSSKRKMDIKCECPPAPPPPVPKVKLSKREMDIECQCPPEAAPSVVCALPTVKSSKREMDIECQCPPEPPPSVKAPKVQSSKRKIDIECECPPVPPPPVQVPKVKLSKREMDIECQCPPEAPTSEQVPKIQSSKREMDIECQCPPESPPPVVCPLPKVKPIKQEMDIDCLEESPPPVQVPEVKPIKREMDTDCECPEERSSFVQVKIRHTDIERQCSLKSNNTAQNKTSKQQIDVECQCPPQIPTSVHPVQKQPKKRKVGIDCECPREKSVPVVEQSIVSTSTNDSCCKCIVIEEPQPTPEKVHTMKRIIQPRTQINTSIKFVKSEEKVSDISCQCFTEDVLQQDTSRQRGRFLQVKTKTSNNKISLNTNLTITMVDKSCQYSEEDILFVSHYNVDKSCQYNRSDFESHREIVCSGPEPEKPRTICTAQRTDSFTVKNMVSVRKVTRSRSIFRCDGVQTSDHSISLENDDDHDYEFFMKIVCADKLSDCPCFND